MFHILLSGLLFFSLFSNVFLVAEKGKWDFIATEELGFMSTPRSLFKGSPIYVQISCEPQPGTSQPVYVLIEWMLTETICWGEYASVADLSAKSELQTTFYFQNAKPNSYFLKSNTTQHHCDGKIVLTPVYVAPQTENGGKLPVAPKNEVSSASAPKQSPDGRQPIFTITKDGLYFLFLNISAVDDKPFKAHVHIEMKGTYGYLSAAEYPLLPFYGIMCIVYVIFAIIWLVVSFLQWRDLLRIQFWIGAVILIGMIEKAMFFEEYNSINSTGESSFLRTIFIAELVSAAKRTLARMLVIIVSLGYGIVKPRLGSHLPRIICVGVTFFILASLEAYPRVMKPPNHLSGILITASLALALLDSFIFYWIFNNLSQTTRTLRLRRNLVKLTLYNHFTNTLIFAVVASFIFMMYTVISHKSRDCLKDWKELWVDDAYWHLLFSIILLVIMILWRPTNNNQRYAFSPLLDAPDDDDDDEEIEHFVNEAYGVKMRGTNTTRSDSPKPRSVTNEDEDLKWVEENIPPCLIDTTFPILDSDEEIVNTKFEMSKME